ncbi:MAG: anaerobic ribonucleoside-triphosphate reductase activating protein [Candidatus Bathyarchaeota archaeon]|nr:MAG: anaerobic ribonucleoside-triphosphate reductase activating protein [Candidatus Bathyarchaeota archaeon]
MPIVRLQRLSLVDYPGNLSAKAVVPGCNFRCPYCVKSALIDGYQANPLVPESEVLSHLYRVRGYLTGLCLGGGEPTLHNGLLAFLYKVKSLGYRVKLDTNGTRPRRIRKLMEERVIDYVAMDVKAPLERYSEVVASKVDVESVEQSIKLLRRGSVDYEFRTTVVPGLVDGRDLEEIARVLIGSKRFVIQQHRLGRTLDPEFGDVKPFGMDEIRSFREKVSPYFAECEIRQI